MKPIDIYHTEGKIDRYIIEAYAREKQVIFPESYIELISNNNFLCPNDNLFKFKNRLDAALEYDTQDIWFMGYNLEHSYPNPALRPILIYNSMTNDKTDPTTYGDEVIAFGNCANGDAVCFDYREGNHDPKIVLMLHDDYEEDGQGEMKMVLIPLADSFDEFIDSLCYEDD
ncbi:MAG: SMI1/KNR4 family protein [Cardiobacterium sp.]|mgnify:FL=1|jgi:SMI1 / KNR4 family protein